MRFMGYYNIVNDYIKLFVIVCEKLSPCLRALTAGPGLAKSLILLLFSAFSLYFSGAPALLLCFYFYCFFLPAGAIPSPAGRGFWAFNFTSWRDSFTSWRADHRPRPVIHAPVIANYTSRAALTGPS